MTTTPEKREDVEGLPERITWRGASRIEYDHEELGRLVETLSANTNGNGHNIASCFNGNTIKRLIAQADRAERADAALSSLLEELRQAREGWSKVGKIAEERTQLAQDALVRLSKAEAQRDAAMREATALATWLHRNHYSEVTQWRPLDDPAGVVSQIDNMIAGILSKAEEQRKALMEALGPFASFGEDNTATDEDPKGTFGIWAGNRCERERIVDWFGPTDFRRAAEAIRAALSLCEDADRPLLKTEGEGA